MDKDFNYKGFDVYYLPHPKLYGNYEIYEGEEFKQRVPTKANAKSFINGICTARKYISRQ